MSHIKIIPVILSGGAGTRLWPLSREACPKQLLALTGEETMLQQTLARVADRDVFAPPLVVAGAAHAGLVAAQLDAEARLIVEPVGRNTAPAIALAALQAAPGDLLLVMPSDHLIADQDAFLAAVEIGMPLAAANWLVTFGIRPDRPETGYGYIKRGERLGDGAFRAAAFVEKPDAGTAQGFVDAGDHDWNGGIFLFRAEALLDALELHAPDILAATRAALSGSGSVDADAFAKIRPLSIDHAVMEKAQRIAIVPVAMGWSDVGSWDALFDVSGKDVAGNAVAGDVLALDSKNCLLRSSGRRIVAIGLEDLIVVETADAILVVPRGQSQRVREAVEAGSSAPAPR